MCVASSVEGMGVAGIREGVCVAGSHQGMCVACSLEGRACGKQCRGHVCVCVYVRQHDGHVCARTFRCDLVFSDAHLYANVRHTSH